MSKKSKKKRLANKAATAAIAEKILGKIWEKTLKRIEKNQTNP